ncbi:MAG: hypothetical protein HN849_04180, partial [Victivallales bacterium]|nr:hypothetical protein [Victivallales bacterium]
MRTSLSRAAALAIVTATLTPSCGHLGITERGVQAMSLTKDDVLSVRDGRFYLEGRPFAEISFNKFDLLWQLYDQL